MNGSIRIIGGKWRGRKLPVLDQEGLRPTTDRLKETLFNWLMPMIQGSSCLDCFAGSGSLGFEALSRGSNHTIFIEKSKSVISQLEKNRKLLQIKNCQIVNIDTFSFLNKESDQQFDLVFIDPPFHKQFVAKTVQLLEERGWLKPCAYIYIETELNALNFEQIPNNWTLHREKITGQVHSKLFIRESIRDN